MVDRDKWRQYWKFLMGGYCLQDDIQLLTGGMGCLFVVLSCIFSLKNEVKCTYSALWLIYLAYRQ